MRRIALLSCSYNHTAASIQTPIVDILKFHSLTGYDTNSSFTAFGKRKCWKLFEQFSHLIYALGRDGSSNEIEMDQFGRPD